MSGSSYSTIKKKTRLAVAQAAVGSPAKAMDDTILV